MSTIAAVSTAQGQGGISVIRVSGKDAFSICDSIFSALNSKKIEEISGYSALYGYVYSNSDKSERLDECVALKFVSPRSYTGENVVELSCHGGMFVTKEVLRAVLDAGAVPAQPGEFTKRAFLNGKLDLTEAEAVMDIISAKSGSAVRSALEVKRGKLFGKTQKIKDILLDKSAHLAAWADYPEEGVPEVEETELITAFDKSIDDLNSLLSSYDMGQAIKNGINTVIIGRPNVGKSTLMNMLTRNEKSIVTSIPGTTRDIIEETVVMGDIILNISDTAGIRETDNEIEKIGVEKAKDKIETASLVLAVFDNNQELTDDDKNIIEQINDIPKIAVINKEDLDNKLNIKYIINKFQHIVYISALQDSGYDALCKEITTIVGMDGYNPNDAVLQNERQRNIILKAKKCLTEAKNTLSMGMTMDAVTVNLEEAVECLLELTGEKASDTIIDKVFENFCVGK